MRIGDLAAATGASARSLRYYEQQGLIASERSGSGQRLYTSAAIERVGLIRELLAAGLSTETIREVLPCVSDPTVRTAWLTERLDDELHRLDGEMQSLANTRQRLAGVISEYRSG